MEKTLTPIRPSAEKTSDKEPNAPAGKVTSGLVVKSLLVLGTLFVCVLILEIGLRMIGRYKMGAVDGFLAPGGVSYVLQSNVTKTVTWPTLTFDVYTSDLGFRAAQPGPRHFGDKPYYAVLGSSEVFGNGLNYDDTFVGVFGQKMASNGIDVVNLAVPGHHLLEQVAVFKQFTLSAKPAPKVVIIVLNPLLMGGYDDIHSDTTVRRGELFDKAQWRLALAKMIVANSSAAYCFFRDGIKSAQAKYFGRQDYALSFYVERYSTKHRIRAPEKTEDLLKELRDLERRIRSLNATPICVYAPAVGGFLLNDLKAKGKLDGTLFDTAFFADLARKHCEAEGIQFINLEPLLQQSYDRGEKLNFDGDAHFNGPTSASIGALLYTLINPSSTNLLGGASN
jgi:hypothetical protein